MYDDETAYDPGLCVGCEWCWYGSPRDCPKCRIIEEDEDGTEES